MSKRRSGRGTLASLAAELGVSRTTVSNAYNRPEQLSPALREKILATAERIGYPGPDPTARSLRTRRTDTIGVLFTDHLSYAFEDLASVDFLAGMAEASFGSHVSLTLIPAGPDGESGINPPQLLSRAVVDGFVVYSVACDDPYLEAARMRRLPIVVCDQPNDTDLPFVGIDDREAIKPAAEAVLAAGHRNIGILAIRLDRKRNDGPVDEARLASARLHVQQARVQGALEVLAAAGIDPNSVPVVERHINDAPNNIDAARELLETHPELTAVICTTDSMALGVLEYARQRGIRVPEDLSVTGFDGISTALQRDVTTIIQPNRAKGAAAGHMLHLLIDAHLADREVEVPRKILKTSFYAGSTVASARS
ncbi:LacI family DNA-binding transcriptional regulator [Corynebacterium epidermidicanis]|uniref:Transcriptional regulator, LacI family n=1 Tax=Corynebacterium epidermidicanis TaxID=1050174 RepID=A0A0G3GRY2_9CORY|nr:LacI family DNA-binding transcriptional regulator [Corynebacterium epidermidicanis]AKK03951.1 transcriptional regulator, LacI family [Corynebacterium epidermidicanis]